MLYCFLRAEDSLSYNPCNNGYLIQIISQQIKSALCRNNSNRSSCSLAAIRKAAILELLTSSMSECGGKDSLPGDIGGEMDGERVIAGDLVTSRIPALVAPIGDRVSGDSLGCSGDKRSGDIRGGSGAVKLANREWK